MSDDSNGDKEKMAEAAADLESALDTQEERTESDETAENEIDGDTNDGGSDTDDALPDPAALIERTETDIESLLQVLNDETTFEEGRDDIEDLLSVIEETEELLETVDVTELPEAVELSELPQAIDGDEVPAAIANAEPGRAIELTQLASLVEFNELWDAVDIREFMRNKEELEDATDEATDDGDDSTDDSSLTDAFESDDSSGSMESSEDEGALLAQGEAKQVAIQSRLRDAVDEFRESVLDARDQLKEARDTAKEQVEEKTGGGTGQPSSRNPTAYSTMVSGWKTGGWSSAGYSTVPQTTQHSSAPGHYRIYGSRFEDAGTDEEEDNE